MYEDNTHNTELSHTIIPIENFNQFVINHQKGGDFKCIQCHPLVGFGVLTTNVVEGLMCLCELKDNIGTSPSLIQFTYQR